MEGLISTDRFQYQKSIDHDTVKKLADLPKLKTIQFYNTPPDEKSLDLLDQIVFKQRKDIHLRIYGDAFKNIDFLNKLKEVERFDCEIQAWDSLQPLYGLKKLVHLGLSHAHPKSKINLKFLRDFVLTLESLNLEGDYLELSNTIQELKNLKAIWLVSTKLESFEFLDGLKIETIGNYGNKVKSFDYLRKLKSLTKVWIKSNNKLDNIDFISDLINLENIELQYVSNVTRFPKCDHLKKLKRVFAFECDRLADIDELKKLTSCQISVQGKSLPGRFFQTKDLI